MGGIYEHKIVLPLECDGKYKFTVDWGDGKCDRITSFDQKETSHEYKEAGRYVVQLNGVVHRFAFSYMKDGKLNERPCRKQIIDISQLGCVEVYW